MPFLDALTSSPFLQQPIDAILLQILISVGWVPIVFVLVWGFIQVYQSFQQGKYVGTLKYVLLAVHVPSATEQSPKALENLFSNLVGAGSSLTWKEVWIIGKLQPVFSFEIVSTEGYIQFYIRTQTRFRDTIEAGIYAHYPDAEISEAEDYTTGFPTKFPNEEYEMWGSELTLKKHEMFPIRTYVDFEDKMTQEIKDPLAQTLESLATMKPGEHFWVQFLVQPNGNDWKDAGNTYIDELFGKGKKPKKSMFTEGLQGAISLPSMVLQEAVGVDLAGMIFGGGDEGGEEDVWKAFKISPLEKEKAEAVLRKVGKNGLATKVRLVYWGRPEVYFKQARTAMVKGILIQYAHLNLNGFGLYGPQTPKDDYFWMRWQYTGKQARLANAYINRSWGTGATPRFLNSEELASLWHFPAVGIRTPLLAKVESRRSEPPPGLPSTFGDDLLPGYKPPGSTPETDVMDEPPLPSLPGVGVTTSGPATASGPANLPIEEATHAPDVFVQPPTVATREVPVREEVQPKELTPLESIPDEVPELVMPSVTPPTRTKNADDDDNSFVPPNLPV